MPGVNQVQLDLGGKIQQTLRQNNFVDAGGAVLGDQREQYSLELSEISSQMMAIVHGCWSLLCARWVAHKQSPGRNLFASWRCACWRNQLHNYNLYMTLTCVWYGVNNKQKGRGRNLYMWNRLWEIVAQKGLALQAKWAKSHGDTHTEYCSI